MEHSFWHERWENNQIGFHAPEPNKHLKKHLDKLALNQGERIFLPLCGKTLDMSWLASKGYQVIGNELVELAAEQFFDEANLSPSVSQVGDHMLYKHGNIEIFVGDFFELDQSPLGNIHAIYDRAALVALPEDARLDYTRHLMEITANASQLLVTFDYDQSVMSGPPFCITDDEVKIHYMDHYKLNLIESEPVPGGLKGQCSANENVWLLK